MLKEKYEALSQREQRILLVATPAVMILLLWLIALKPALEHQSELEHLLKQKQADIAWMQAAHSKLKKQPLSTADKLPLRQKVNSLLTQHQITPERIQSNQSHQLSIWTKSVPFERVLRAIESAQRSGLVIAEAQISKTDSAGAVDAKLTFEG